MRLRGFLAAALIAAAQAGPARAFGSAAKGTSGAQFLEMEPGARAAAMGGAYAGIVDDAYAVYYNPAGLAGLRRVEAAGMEDRSFQGVRYDFAGAAVPLLAFQRDALDAKNAYGVLGVGVYGLSLNDIPVQGNAESESPAGTVVSQDTAYSLSYALAVGETGLALGVTGKYVVSALAGYNAAALAGDAGALYRTERWSAGAGLRNLGQRYGFVERTDPLPLTLFAGGGYRFSERWLGSAELDLPRDNGPSAAAGVEYSRPFPGRITGAVRAGYNTSNRDAGGTAGTSIGAGIGYGNLDFDFAFIPFGELGNAYRYSLRVKF